MIGPEPRGPHRGTDVEKPVAVPPATVRGDVALLRPHGEFDMANQRDLGAAIHDSIISGALSVVIDLGEVTFIDVSVIHMLLRSQRMAESRGCRLSLINVTVPSALVLRVLGIGVPLWDGREDPDHALPDEP